MEDGQAVVRELMAAGVRVERPDAHAAPGWTVPSGRTLELTTERTRSTYAATVPDDMFMRLLSWSGSDNPLYQALVVLGIRDIDWSGHFGPHVFYSVAAEGDTEELHALIRDTIARLLANED